MLPHIKRLEEAVASASAEIRRLKEENEVLAGKVKAFEEARGRTLTQGAAARELADFKDRLRRRLERICQKIEKYNDLQPGLFGEHDE
jgi:hypothetical protein